MDLPNKRPDDMVRITTAELANKFIEEQIALVKQQVEIKRCYWLCLAVWIAP